MPYNTHLFKLRSKSNLIIFGDKNFLSAQSVILRTCAFTSILPCPATKFHLVYTCMKNYRVN